MRRALFESDLELRERPFRWMWQVWRLLTAELWLRAQSGANGALAPDPAPSTAQLDFQGPLAAPYLFPP